MTFPLEYPAYYFFYGTLTNPQNLKRILDLEEDPPMRKAEVIGYALAKWGDYPALIDGEQGQIISGYAYQVQSEGKAQKLMYYETNAYKAAPVWIYFRDGDDDDDTTTKVPGKGFIYAGDPKALLEQRFDRKLWALQMGDKLG